MAAVLLEYYQPAFLLIGGELDRRGYLVKAPHPLRKSFWSLVAPGEYDPFYGRALVSSYLTRIERELDTILARQSVGYWLHLYRRIGLGPAGKQDDPKTISLVRAILEAAIQKYASFDQCSRIGISNEIPTSEVLKGILMASEFEMIRKAIQENPQIVLTDFGVDEMQEFYDVERLAFEVWKSTAIMRIMGKGATLVVEGNDPYFYDGRSDELDRLVTNYDRRHREPFVTATGTVFADGISKGGLVFLPTYNVYHVSSQAFLKFFEFFKLNLAPTPLGEFEPNFLWTPFNLRSYYAAHRPFAQGFEIKYGVPLEWILAVLASLLSRVFYDWVNHPIKIIHFWQRAYEGPYKEDSLEEEIRVFLPEGIRTLGLGLEPEDVDLHRTLSFFRLTQEKRASINIGLASPHFMLLPFNSDRVFVDYCWCHWILYDLFFDVECPDQSFKGEALETLVHGDRSALPTKPCKSFDDESRQIDAAFKLRDTLIIVECRSFARSFGVDRGDMQALRYRR
jgi:hypothetical protein